MVGGIILYSSELVKYSVNAPYDVWESLYVVCHPCEGGVGKRSVFVAFCPPQESHHLFYGLHRSSQVKQFCFLQVSAFESYSCHRFSYVEEEVQREVVMFFRQPSELPCLSQSFVYLIYVCRHHGGVVFLFPHVREAMASYYCSYLVEAYFAFKILWINHGAKLHILHEIAKKTP